MERKYVSVKDPEKGFYIIEQDQVKYKRNGDSVKTGKKEYSIWIDEFEGGEAGDDDWEFINDGFLLFQSAYNWVVKNYGEIKEI